MSTETGDSAIVAGVMADAKALLTAAQADEEQLDLLEQPTPEEMAEARERLGPNAGRLAVLRDARQARGKGRPPGSKNRRTDDFARYLLSHGQHPAITMMQIQATPPEVLIENSVAGGKRMTYEAAQSLRIRCAEGLLPYIESKKPIAVDATIHGVMVIEEIGGHAAPAAIDGEFVEVATDADDLGEAPR